VVPEGETAGSSSFYALIDGNKIPKDMPCPAEAVVKGDGKEFMIAAASILAKVTRDRLMHAYDKEYPDYHLKRHKGYPTADHMKAVAKLGASPIHRRTFAPLKHMELDETGKVVLP
jgi:ribonuclease HII